MAVAILTQLYNHYTWVQVGRDFDFSSYISVLQRKATSFPPVTFFLPLKACWVWLEAFIKGVKCLNSRQTSGPGGALEVQSIPPWVSPLWMRRLPLDRKCKLWIHICKLLFCPRFLGSGTIGCRFRSKSRASHLVYQRKPGMLQAASLWSHSLGRCHPLCICGRPGPWCSLEAWFQFKTQHNPTVTWA